MQNINKLQEIIDRVVNGQATQYINLPNDNGDLVTIRVSDHNANPSRMESVGFSLVVNRIEEEQDSEGNWSINKKEFRDLENQYQLDENGEFEDNFSNLKQFFNYADLAY